MFVEGHPCLLRFRTLAARSEAVLVLVLVLVILDRLGKHEAAIGGARSKYSGQSGPVPLGHLLWDAWAAGSSGLSRRPAIRKSYR